MVAGKPVTEISRALGIGENIICRGTGWSTQKAETDSGKNGLPTRKEGLGAALAYLFN